MPTPAASGDLFQRSRDADAASLGLIVRVAVQRAIDSAGADTTLTYAAGSLPLRVGDCVYVPLGRSNTPTPAVVLAVGGAELLDSLDPDRVKRVLSSASSPAPRSNTPARAGSRTSLTHTRIAPSLPPFDSHLLELARWISDYYVCPIGTVLGAMRPASLRAQAARRVVVTFVRTNAPPSELPRNAQALARTLGTIDPAAFPMDAAALRSALGARTNAPVKRLLSLGLIAPAALDAAAPEPLTQHPLPPAPATTPPVLNAEQTAAVNAITASLSTFQPFLLFGITGSGKTEVYLRAIHEALARGSSAIVLVPEIALTPQTSRRFIDRFSAPLVAVLHSGLTPSQRAAEWSRVARSEARVVVGARSAIFAPVQRLGLIVADEEHDSSYKQDQAPRYHARDVAVKRAQLAACPVVLGSATPSLESWFNAVTPTRRSSPAYTLLRLTSRAAGGAALPRVRIVDLAEERRLRARLAGSWKDRRVHLLGPTLEAALDETLAAGQQAILLLNRRGYASYIVCPSEHCGFVLGCSECDALLVWHRSTDLPPGGVVRCHHCLAEQLLPAACPLCTRRLNTFGLGTQRVEEEIEARFGPDHALHLGSTLLRVDSDTMRTSRDYFDTLDRFARGHARVLVGTQMLAKGLDFPGVTLVGVVSADTALNLPDFRASERTFQLIAQAAGRAGRGATPGRVIVQTMCPAAPAIVHAAAHDFESFARHELDLRRGAGLPPASRMVRVVCRDRDHARAVAAARIIAEQAAIEAEAIHAHAAPRPRTPAVRIRGPMPCAISRVAGYHRVAVELIASTRGVLQSILARLRARALVTSDASTAVDVDPIALL